MFLILPVATGFVTVFTVPYRRAVSLSLIIATIICFALLLFTGIEIQNIGDAALNLEGYRLTDIPSEPSRWIFPRAIVDPGDYLVIFASGQDRNGFVDSGGNLHTNFKLALSGEYLALAAPDGTILSHSTLSHNVNPSALVGCSFILSRLTFGVRVDASRSTSQTVTFGLP